MHDETRRHAHNVRDGLDDSWFDRPEHKKIAAELRARLSRPDLWVADRGDSPAPPGAAQPGLDDSWFK